MQSNKTFSLVHFSVWFNQKTSGSPLISSSHFLRILTTIEMQKLTTIATKSSDDQRTIDLNKGLESITLYCALCKITKSTDLLTKI